MRKLKEDKRAQFYLIAAIIIIIALSSLTTTKNYIIANSKSNIIQEVSLNLKKEAPKIIEYAFHNQYNQEDKEDLIKNFTSRDFAEYFLEKINNANIIFIYGNKTSLHSIQYKKEKFGNLDELVAVVEGDGGSWNDINEFSKYAPISDINSDDNITVTVFGSQDFDFDLIDSEIFYFLIIQKKGNETFIERN